MDGAHHSGAPPLAAEGGGHTPCQMLEARSCCHCEATSSYLDEEPISWMMERFARSPPTNETLHGRGSWNAGYIITVQMFPGCLK